MAVARDWVTQSRVVNIREMDVPQMSSELDGFALTDLVFPAFHDTWHPNHNRWVHHAICASFSLTRGRRSFQLRRSLC